MDTEEIPTKGMQKNRNVPPSIRYRVVEIEQVRQSGGKREGETDAQATKRALHVCRGHFAHYTEDAPLFGKHVGQFWVPDHTRGSFNRGAILKDYKTG